MIQENGSVFYQDEYSQCYDVSWETVNGDLDITSIVSQPFVWGQDDQGFVQNHRVFRLGIITVTRQVIRPLDGGYMIIAEGTSQYIDYVQTNFICERKPSDNFAYHINCGICDDVEGRVSDGSNWTDPDENSDSVWVDVLNDGTPVIGTYQPLEWLDVWPSL